MQPYMGLGNSLQTAQGGSGAVGGWVELGRTTASASETSLSVSGLADKRYYQVITSDHGIAGAPARFWRFNNDSGSNYARRVSTNGGADGTNTSQAQHNEFSINNTKQNLSIHYIANLPNKEKLHIAHGVGGNSSAASVPPARLEFTGKWANTSDAINRIDYIANAGSFSSGDEIVVLGWDPADTHTTNFWEELIDYTHSGGAAATSTSGTFTAKKYLWCQTFNPEKPSGSNVTLLFNSTTGAEYTTRYNQNGGSDATLVNRSDGIHLNVEAVSGTATGFFTNIFIVNNSANDKLVMTHTSSGWTNAGAGVAPARSETVGKWANTSTQINQIELNGPASGVVDGTIIKVWGSD